MRRIGTVILNRVAALSGIAALCLSAAAGGAEPSLAGSSSASELPPLSKAREVGRSKSALLASGSPKERSLPAGPPTANLVDFKKHIAPVLTKTCVACHGPKKSKGKFRIDTLDPDLMNGDDVDWWLEVLDVLSNGEMPPDDAKVELADTDLRKIIEWLGPEIQKASTGPRREKSHSSFRRMARYEYDYALQDLLGLPYSLVDRLPPETASEDGFKNSSEMLQMSAMQFEIYREIGLKALKHATATGDRPKMVVYRLPGQDDKLSSLDNENIGEVLALTQKAKKAKKGEEVEKKISFDQRNHSLKLNLSNHLPDEGVMRVTVRAGRSTLNADDYMSLRLDFSAHTSNNANFSQVVSARDVPVTASADDPQFLHFDIPLSEIQRNPFRNNTEKFPRRDEFLTIRAIASTRKDNELLSVPVDFIEISAPFFAQWPPQSHREIFIESGNKTNEQVYGREVLTRFMARAWRRPVTSKEVEPFMALFTGYRPDFASLEEAMLEVLATVLATPEFLYLAQEIPASDAESPTTISELELASRLSFFLWSSVPDVELLYLASKGELKDAIVLAAQVKRMLADSRSRRFSENFVHQWLGMDGLESVTHVNESSLKEAMAEEPIAFFEEVLDRNSSVMDFIHSDYAVVNERLASHYQMRDVYGPHFRKVSIKPEANRGGILTGAAILAMNSDGKDSHPLKRGVWMLERILDDPPPPPPPNVPEVDLTDPRILQMTLKERIADHRNKPACISCHAKIDPWGIAFENYDALGSFRTKIEDKPVDATAALFNKQELAGMDGLKRYLLADRQDQFSRAMVHKLTAYALGRPLSFGDRADIESLSAQFRKKGDRLGDLISLIITSRIFHSK
ncbi:MAG: mono/diheme cytochrome c family protein [Akkermansiaceae bacterium]|jgi:mono/diheme cytochrome c family protein